MSQLLLEDIPNRMVPKVVHARHYMPSRTERKVLALTTDLHLYEVAKKQIIFDCDISATGLRLLTLKLEFDRVENRMDVDLADDPAKSSFTESEEHITFGKYFTCFDSQKRLFILVKAFDKLVVIERAINGFRFVKEFANVDRFEITDPDSNYHVFVAIYSLGTPNPILETFVAEKSEPRPSTSKEVSTTIPRGIQMVSELIDRAKADLMAARKATQREFVSIKDQLMFGPKVVRCCLEELQMLGRYGDLWMKICHDYLIIGMPVINNCSKRLTVLHNVRAVLVNECRENLEYECDVFQLCDDSYTFESIGSLLDNSCMERSELTFNKEWRPIRNRMLRPETTAIVCVKVKLNLMFNNPRNGNRYNCFVLYEVDDVDTLSRQQVFIQTLEVTADILCLPEYQVTFDVGTIYRDLLAIAATSEIFAWTMESQLDTISSNLQRFLLNNFQFTQIVFKGKKIATNEDDNDEELFPSSQFHQEVITKEEESLQELFYHIPAGHSHLKGTLIRVQSSSAKARLKVYVTDEYKALYIYTKLVQDFDDGSCKIQPDSSDWESLALKRNLQKFRQSLQQEIEIAIENVKMLRRRRKNICTGQIRLYARELETDLLMLKI